MKLRNVFVSVLFVLLIFGVAACGNSASDEEDSITQGGQETEEEQVISETEKDGNLKFVYVSKMLSHPWFQQQEMGIKAACEELGIEYVGIDSNLNDEKALADIDTAFSMEADALLLVITNRIR